MQRTLTASQPCSVVILPHPFFNCDHHFSTLLRPYQLFSIFATLFNSSQSCSISSHLSSTLFASSLLFSTLLNDSQLCPPRFNSSQLFSPLATSSTLPTSSHLRSTHLTSFTAHLNSSHLLNSGQLFSTLSFYTEKIGEAFTHSKLLHTEAFTHSKPLHREVFTQSKLLHRESFTHSKPLYREAATQDAPKLRNICCQSTIRNLHATTFYNLRFPAAKDIKSILHAAAAARNLDAAIPRRSAETELQSTQESRTTATQTAAPKPDLDAQAEKRRF